jgi:putative tricarboxylic transport membrane protein
VTATPDRGGGHAAAGSFIPEARLVPRLVCAGGAIVSALLVFTEFGTWCRAAEPGVMWTRDVAVALKTFIWMVVFLGLTTLFGYLAALLLFVPAFLFYVARAKPRTVIVYGLALAGVIGALPSLVPVDRPIGLLNTP